VFARDLDGDKQLDVIAIDQHLRIYTALSSLDGVLRADAFPGIPATVLILTSTISGAPTSP
jgi:hypothetical protein